MLNLVSGVFGKWFEDFIERFGGETIELAVPYNDAIDPDEVRRILSERPVSLLLDGALGNPSGTKWSIQSKEIGQVCCEYGVITMVDTVSGLASELRSPEEWGLDVAIAGPRNCLGGTGSRR